jgi:hypothetical protein
MRKITAAACAVLAWGACATAPTAKPEPTSAPAGPVREQLAVTNNSPFDLASCGGRALELEPLTEEVVLGALLTRGPAFQECFLDPKSSDGAVGPVSVKATVSSSGAAVSVEGSGLSASGRACLEAAAQGVTFPALSAGAAAVSGQVPVAVSVKPVAWGVNPASDAAATLRLGLPSMCRCFAELRDAVPPQPVVKLKLAPAATPEVLVDGLAGNPEVAGCIAAQVRALPLPEVDLELGLPLLLVNGWAGGAAPDSSAALRFQQLEAVRARRTAEVLIAAGRRGGAATRYDEVVKKYKAKPNPALIAELKTKCAAVLAGDDAHLAALTALMDVYRVEGVLVAAEKAKDPAWARVEPGLNQQLAQTSNELARVEQQKVSDAAACPKSR